MPLRTYIYSYKPFSTSARLLSQQLGIRRIKHENSKFVPALRKRIINWGSSELPDGYEHALICNSPLAVSRVTNKLHWFQQATGEARVPAYTVDKQEAAAWETPVMARSLLTGHSGQGMVYCPVGTELPDVPLYVQYIKKKQEYRVHIIRNGNQNAVFIQRKARRTDTDDADVNWQIRNHSNGFVYTNSDEAVGDVPDDVMTQAVEAMEASGLDFGAVDVIWNEHRDQAYVLEINTAPGITGRTLQFYTDTFKEYYNL